MSLMKDLRDGKALMTDDGMVIFRGPNIVIFRGERFVLRDKTVARIKKERTRRNLPWTVELA